MVGQLYYPKSDCRRMEELAPSSLRPSLWCHPLANVNANVSILEAVSRKSRKLFGPEKPFQKLRSIYSKKLAFNYDFKIRKGKFVAKFHARKRLRF